MPQVLTTLYAFVLTRKEALTHRDERGNLIEWLILAVMGIIVVVFMIPGVKDLAGRVLTFIGDQLGV